MPRSAKPQISDEQKVLDLVEGMYLDKAVVVVNMLATRIHQRKEGAEFAKGKAAQTIVASVTGQAAPPAVPGMFPVPNVALLESRPRRRMVTVKGSPKARTKSTATTKPKRSHKAKSKPTPGTILPPEPILPADIPRAPGQQRVQLGSVSAEDDGGL